MQLVPGADRVVDHICIRCILVTALNFLPLVFLRLVFTSDGVGVGVAIRRVERYNLVKIKPMEWEAEHCLCLRCLRSSENCIVGVTSGSGRINQWQCSIPDFAIGWFFHFCFRLRQPTCSYLGFPKGEPKVKNTLRYLFFFVFSHKSPSGP